MCDFANDKDNKLKIEVRHQTINNDTLQPNVMESCDCTSEDDSEPIVKTRNRITTNTNDSRSNASKSCDCSNENDSQACMGSIKTSCDCTSEDASISYKGSTKKSCDCTSEDNSRSCKGSIQKSCDCTSEGDNDEKVEIRDGATTTDTDIVESPFAIVQVALSKSMLNLLPSTESSTSCDCTSSKNDSQDNSSRCNKDDSSQVALPSCDCTTESNESSVKSDDGREKKMEWTLAIIKPEAVIFRLEIERIIEEEGFSICQTRWLHLTAEQASDFYRDNYEQKNFAQLVAYMSSEPIVVYVLSKLDAIAEWKMLIGPNKISEARVYAPDSIRGKYGIKSDDDSMNAVHGSCDERAARREIRFFFPDCILEPILQDEAAEEFLWKKVNDVLSEGLVKCCEEKPVDPVVWLANWLLDNNATRPKYLLRSTSNLYD